MAYRSCQQITATSKAIGVGCPDWLKVSRLVFETLCPVPSG